jgi:hypothetical protein
MEVHHQHHGNGAKAINLRSISIGRQGQHRLIHARAPPNAERLRHTSSSSFPVCHFLADQSYLARCVGSEIGFGRQKQLARLRFFRAFKSALRRLDKNVKNPI